uniref:Endosomal/lysosomal proton channel TMEM175 n=1 Tax=Branchiostoma floridae TaxID=7739 RepID=C3Z623_BRAFL|eukprot:XP_002596274.1 hypothetical protein BRAFLDRAFT_65969 [Branchiostoma floridae]
MARDQHISSSERLLSYSDAVFSIITTIMFLMFAEHPTEPLAVVLFCASVAIAGALMKTKRCRTMLMVLGKPVIAVVAAGIGWIRIEAETEKLGVKFSCRHAFSWIRLTLSEPGALMFAGLLPIVFKITGEFGKEILPLSGEAVKEIADEENLLTGLGEMWFKLLIYAISFFLVSSSWEVHTWIFRMIEKVNETIVLLNLPTPCAFQARWQKEGGDARQHAKQFVNMCRSWSNHAFHAAKICSEDGHVDPNCFQEAQEFVVKVMERE